MNNTRRSKKIKMGDLKVEDNTKSYTKQEMDGILKLLELGVENIIIMYEQKVYTSKLNPEDVVRCLDVLDCICKEMDPSMTNVYTEEEDYTKTPSSMILDLFNGINKITAIVYLNDYSGEIIGDPMVKNFDAVKELILNQEKS